MGIMISLEIIPNKIKKSEWEQVYEEALKLIETYPFMDKIVIEDKHDTFWFYADRTRERKLRPWYDKPGVYIIGDMKTGEHAENFTLMRDLDFYKHDDTGKDTRDIFLSIIEGNKDITDEIKNKRINSRTIFNSKTQGLDYHKYILAIACLIEGRFPESAVVTGDISIGQMREAIAWADEILEKPIPLTERANRVKLLSRLDNSLQSEYALLQSFMELDLSEPDNNLGNLLQSKFSKKIIKQYFINRFSVCQPGTIGFSDNIEMYFNIGFDLDTLCEICVIDKDGCCSNEDDFIKAVLNSGLNSNEQWGHDITELAVNDPDSKEPDTVDTLMEKSLFKLAFGNRHTTTKYLSLLEIKEIFAEKFKKPQSYYQNFIDGVFVNNEESSTLEAGSKFSEVMEILQQKKKDLEKNTANYDISRANDLYLWKPNCSISPTVEENLKSLKKFIEDFVKDKGYCADFVKLSNLEKLNSLKNQNQYFLIRKETWDYITDQVENDDVIIRIYALLSVKADEMSINNICTMVFWNIELLKGYFLKKLINYRDRLQLS